MRTLLIAALASLLALSCGPKLPRAHHRGLGGETSIPDGWSVPEGIETIEQCERLAPPERDYCREALSETTPPERPTRDEPPHVEAVAPTE